MPVKYSDERNAQIIVSLLKQHGIRKIIASPGTTNYPVVASCQYDPFFEVISCVDERSAAYMACGMAATSGEPVVISCTGATASRNYLSALTEAYYRKLPVIAITSFNGSQNIGQLMPQNIDRTQIQHDVAVVSVDVPVVKDERDVRYCSRIVNQAILGTQRRGGGPVHINVSTNYDSNTFSSGEVPLAKPIRQHQWGQSYPEIPQNAKVAVFVGPRMPFDKETEEALDGFARSHNAVVFCDHTSNYRGHYSFLSTLAADNTTRSVPDFGRYRPNLIIHIGEVSGDYPTMDFLKASGAPTWRVNPDGEIRDRFGTLTDVFEMDCASFFRSYAGDDEPTHSYYELWKKRDAKLRAKIPDLPFSNRWIAQQAAPVLPSNSIAHFAILNSLRSWNYFPYDFSIRGYSNTGGFGIDGALSTMVGSALAEPQTQHFAFVGDLAFFYDMNVLGNRSLPNNMHILVVNNGTGVEFHMPYSPAQAIGKDVDQFVAAAHHFVSKDPQKSAVHTWTEVMGCRYLQASGKNDFKEALREFVKPTHDRPIVLECFTNAKDEAAAASMLRVLDPALARTRQLKDIAKKVLPTGAIKAVKKIGGGVVNRSYGRVISFSISSTWLMLSHTYFMARHQPLFCVSGGSSEQNRYCLAA